MTAPPPFVVELADWQGRGEALRAVRRTVFVDEQHVPEALEWDEEDAPGAHAIALAPDGTPVGTGRLLRDGHIGRMAVIRPWRGRGVGSAILRFLLVLAARNGHASVRLHAQTHALGFYARHGFQAEGAEFMEAGILHVAMWRAL